MHQAGGVADGYLLAVAGPKVSARESQHGAPKHRAWQGVDLCNSTKATWHTSMTKHREHHKHDNTPTTWHTSKSTRCPQALGLACVIAQKHHDTQTWQDTENTMNMTKHQQHDTQVKKVPPGTGPDLCNSTKTTRHMSMTTHIEHHKHDNTQKTWQHREHTEHDTTPTTWQHKEHHEGHPKHDTTPTWQHEEHPEHDTTPTTWQHKEHPEHDTTPTTWHTNNRSTRCPQALGLIQSKTSNQPYRKSKVCPPPPPPTHTYSREGWPAQQQRNNTQRTWRVRNNIIYIVQPKSHHHPHPACTLKTHRGDGWWTRGHRWLGGGISPGFGKWALCDGGADVFTPATLQWVPTLQADSTAFVHRTGTGVKPIHLKTPPADFRNAQQGLYPGTRSSQKETVTSTSPSVQKLSTRMHLE